MDYFKKIERSVTISADKRSTVDLQVDVWSQDLNVTKFILKLDTTDSATIDLTNATVRVAMVYNQDGQDVKIEAAGIVEDVATQKIAYIMDDKLAGFEGTVTAGFYVTLSTGQRIDIQNVTFNMRKSLLDKDLDVPTEDYYQTFDDILADVQSEGEKAKTQINQVLPDVQAEGEKVKTEINAVLPTVNSYADTQKQAIDGVVSDVNGYADTQKQAIDNIVSDVQSTGDTAKEDIKATLPTLQTKISQLSKNYSELKEDLGIDVPLLFSQIGYVNKSGVFVSHDSYRATDFIEIIDNLPIVLTTSIIDNQARVCYYRDNSYSDFIGYDAGFNSSDTQTVNLTIPNGAKYIIVSCYKLRIYDANMKYGKVVENLSNLYSSVDALRSNIISELTEENYIKSHEWNYGYISKSGFIENADKDIYSYTNNLIIKKGSVLTVKGTDPSGTVVAFVSKWSKNGVFEKALCLGSKTEQTFIYEAEEDVEFIRICKYKNDTSFKAVFNLLNVPEASKKAIEIYSVSDKVESDMNISMFSSIGVCGDSYSEGAICTRDSSVGTISVLGYCPYGNIISRLSGCDVTTFAKGGINTYTYQTDSDCLPAILSDTPKDLYIFSLGINDYTLDSTRPLGTIADINDIDYTQNANTFYGNYGKIIAQVKEHSPNAKIILSTVFIPTYSNGSYYSWSADAIREIAEHFEIMFIDTNNSVFMKSALYNNVINSNGSHPTAPLYSGIAKEVKTLVNECIVKNIDYFNSYIPNPVIN